VFVRNDTPAPDPNAGDIPGLFVRNATPAPPAPVAAQRSVAPPAAVPTAPPPAPVAPPTAPPVAPPAPPAAPPTPPAPLPSVTATLRPIAVEPTPPEPPEVEIPPVRTPEALAAAPEPPKAASEAPKADPEAPLAASEAPAADPEALKADPEAPATAPEPPKAASEAPVAEAIPAAPKVPADVAAVVVPVFQRVASSRPTARGIPVQQPRGTGGFTVPMPTPMGGSMTAPAAAPPAAVAARASVRPPSQPPRTALTWRPEREAAAEQLAARLLVLPLFQELDPESRRRYAREASMLSFAAGEVMVPAPAPGEHTAESALLMVVEGTAVTAVPGDDMPVALLGPGDFTGELGALHGGIPVAETVARTEVRAVAFAPSLVRAMAREQTSVRRALDEVAWERAFAALGRGARLFARLRPLDRERAFSAFEPTQLEEGALLLSEGRSPDALWLLAAGEVEVYGGALEGIWRARAGEALGLFALLDASVAGVTARAVRTVLAARLPAAKFARLLRDHPSLYDARDDLGVVC
jgi:CRP-like cAMP-binding protein